jgi:hypothetical protein
MAVMEALVEAEDDTEAEPEDWADELSVAVQRVMVAADALRDDRDLMRGARRLLDDVDGTTPDFFSRIFEVVAGCLMVEAAEQQRRARRGRGAKSER